MLTVDDLHRFQIDLETGFVPVEDPLLRLPPYYEPWEAIAAQMGELLLTGQLRRVVDRLPRLSLDNLPDAQARQRAMLLLSVIGNAYVWGVAAPATHLPAQVALPWCALAEHLGRPAIAAHESMVLNNWRRVDPSGPVALGNVATLAGFQTGPDEQWFYLVTLQIELDGARALPAMVRAQAAVARNRPAALQAELLVIRDAVAAMLVTLNRMIEKCDPYIFYHRIRPFFSGWPEPGLIYEGVDPVPRQLIGGSAAQSALVQALDVGLGVTHTSERTGPFLLEMRNYMPRTHRRFLEALAEGPALRPFIAAQTHSHPELAATYNACLANVASFRQKHIEISVRYIVHQAPDKEAATGTGGTAFVPFLSEARKETVRQQLGPKG